MPDIYDLMKNPELIGLTKDVIEDFDRHISIITWRENKERGGIIGEHKSGRKVFPDRDFQDSFLKDESWFCDVRLYGESYKARPIQKIDSSYLYQLKSEQVDEVIEILWEKKRSLLQPMLESKVLEKQAELENQVSEKFEKDIELIKREKERLMDEMAADKKIIESLQKKLESRPNEQSAPTGSNSSTPSYHEAFFGFDSTPKKFIVIRDAPDEIFSDVFTKSRYFIHVSKDGKLMSIRPHESGSAICIDGRITLFGLNDFLPFENIKEFEAITSVEGGLMVQML